MGFEATISQRSVFGNKAIVWGTFTNTASATGGEIDTGLSHIDFISCQITGAAAMNMTTSINETLPLSSGIVTLVSTNDAVGIWFAMGTL